jgi:beta-glucosidase
MRWMLHGGLVVVLAAGLATAGGLPYQNPAVPVDERVKDLLGRMTVAEKVDQLQCQLFADGKGIKDEKGRPREYTFGSLYHYTRSSKPSVMAELNNEDQRQTIAQSRLGIPALMHEVAHHGISCAPGTMFPTAFAMAATWDLDLAARVYGAIAEETLALNIRQVTEPPVINLCRDPRWGRTEETYGEDAFLSARFGVSASRAFNDRKIVGTAKHFVCNYGDGGRDSAGVYFSERELREYWLVPFEAAVREGNLQAIMPAYNAVNGRSCHANPWLLTDVLRNEWGFRGIVCSDYGDHGLGTCHLHHLTDTPEEGAALVTRSGVDVNWPNGNQHLGAAVEKGFLSMEHLDRAVARVLRVKFLNGLFDRPFVDPARADRVVRCQPHLELSLEAARKAIVLLKNSENTLPLKKSGKIGVFGPAAAKFHAGGYGRYVMPSDIAPLTGLKDRAGGAVEFLVHDGKADPAALAKQCDAAVVFVTIVEGEGFDRCNLDLPVFKAKKEVKAVESDYTILVEQAEREFTEGDQEALIRAVGRTGVPTVVVLVTGAPVTMTKWIADADAIVQMGYAGERGGLAIADVLFGDCNPGGKLPMTFPRSVGQCPLYYNVPPTGRSGKYWDDDGKPQFPFGFGLSYTTFDYSGLKAESTVNAAAMTGEVTVMVKVKNTGGRAGDDVVQVYCFDEKASVARPRMELKGFQRLTLNPGEQRTATIRVPASELALWNLEMKRVIEPGGFKIMIGRDAQDIVLKGRVDVR